MSKKFILKKIVLAGSLLAVANISYAEGFKRFSVSAGWLHVMPQGKANPFNINTAVPKGTVANVGAISPDAFINAIDPDAVLNDEPKTNAKEFLKDTLPTLGEILGVFDEQGNISADVTGTTTINGIDQWRNEGTGLEAEDADTLGLMVNYYINDNVSLQFIGGIPPKVDIKGKGEIVANMNGIALPQGDISGLFPNGELPLLTDIPITNLGNKNKAATVRAWTPALEVQYQFGKSGINKFRPYIGAGVMYAHFNDIKLDGGINSDLIAAGHMIQNILDGKAGAALDKKVSSANPYVKVKAEDAFAPIITLGATYDISDNWYSVASVSYAKLNNKTTIDVTDGNTGTRLINSSTKIDIDPLITYVGVGYRF